MLANNVSALKENFVTCGFNHVIMEHPHIRYFLKSTEIILTLCPVSRNMMALDTLKILMQVCRTLFSVTALKKSIAVYHPSSLAPLFQFRTQKGFRIFMETNLRKTLLRLNALLGLNLHHYSFQSFRRRRDICVYNTHVLVQIIKTHVSWASDCVCTYIQQDEARSAEIATSF